MPPPSRIESRLHCPVPDQPLGPTGMAASSPAWIASIEIRVARSPDITIGTGGYVALFLKPDGPGPLAALPFPATESYVMFRILSVALNPNLSEVCGAS